jgi:hypothetical protein
MNAATPATATAEELARMVSVSVKSGVRHLRVDRHVAVTSWPRLVARSSDARAPSVDPESDKWPEGLAWSVADRLRNGGDAKGRAIGIWQESQDGNPALLAVGTWHDEDAGPLYLLDIGSRTDLEEKTRRTLEAELLAIMLEISGQPGAAVAEEWQRTLRWMTAQFDRAPNKVKKTYARAALERAKRLSFERLSPPSAVPTTLRKGWVGERIFE